MVYPCLLFNWIGMRSSLLSMDGKMDRCCEHGGGDYLRVDYSGNNHKLLFAWRIISIGMAPLLQHYGLPCRLARMASLNKPPECPGYSLQCSCYRAPCVHGSQDLLCFRRSINSHGKRPSRFAPIAVIRGTRENNFSKMVLTPFACHDRSGATYCCNCSAESYLNPFWNIGQRQSRWLKSVYVGA